jgi:hemolysin III
MQRPFRRAEILADGVVHAVALLIAAAGVVALAMHAAFQRSAVELSATLIYGLGLILMLSFSFAYNMATQERLKALLRRFDHSGIYLLIAGTYTPLLTQLDDLLTAWILGAVVWIGALAGILLKFALPRRFENGSVLVYLMLSWAALPAIGPIAAAVPESTVTLLLAGGVLYTAGILFYVWERLLFQRAIWHGFVVSAATCHFGAIAACLGVQG